MPYQQCNLLICLSIEPQAVNTAKKIRIKAGLIEAIAELNDSTTVQKIWEAVSTKGRGNLWGEEIYFPIILSLKLEDGQELVHVR